MRLTALERRVLDAVDADNIVDTTKDLIGFDTTARVGAGVAHDEARLQRYVGARAAAAGADVDIWEPSSDEVPASRQVPAGLNWAGFPQLLATVVGAGGGRRLLLNGHIDAVSAEPRDLWSADPFHATVRDGRVYGRGAVDMKGGVAAILIALETLQRCEVRLLGDLILSTVTDEESTSAGGVATVAHGVQAD